MPGGTLTPGKEGQGRLRARPPAAECHLTARDTDTEATRGGHAVSHASEFPTSPYCTGEEHVCTGHELCMSLAR